MTKGQGYAAIGAVVLAGVVFRNSIGFGPSQGLDKSRETAAKTSEKTMTGEGPWLASCRYWAAVQQASPSDAAKTTPKLSIKLNQTDTTFDAAIAGSVDDKKTVCEESGGVWGIPIGSDDKTQPGDHKPQPEIHAIIVAVADPIHSHLALVFDRTIDSLMQAAADNQYLSSSYWLPWRNPSVTQLAEANQAEDRKRLEQPGLIILKFSPATTKSPEFATTSYYHVVYLFLVGESPALGMDGMQLRNALKYEEYLRATHGAVLSMESPGSTDASNTLAFIGPRSSGSATSLRQALLSANFAEPPDRIVGAGITSTEIAQAELNDPSKDPSKPPITYTSFGEDVSFEENHLLAAFKDSGTDATRTAILVEDNTVFGAASVAAPSDDGHTKGKENVGSPLYIRFPREISLLRNAQVEQGVSSPQSQAPSPFLNLSLKDPGADDTIPKLSATQTPLSQEAQLMAIERQLQKAHTQYILITASNILDEIFLARELHRACPNATIVFYNGGDLLVERDVDNAPYIGSITASPYSLVSFDQPSKESRRFFSDSESAAVYNAASYVFWWGSEEWGKGYPPRLAGSYESQQGSRQFLQFPLMVTAVGADGYYPLGILSPCASESARMLPRIRIHGANSGSDACAIPSLTAVPFPELPSPVPSMFWYLLCAFLIAMCLIHAIVLRSASYWSSLTRDLDISKNDQPRRRTVYVHIGTSMLVSMAIVLTVPWFTFGWKERWHTQAFLAACLTIMSAVAAAKVTLSKTAAYRSPQKDATSEDQTRLYPWFNRIAAAAVAVVLIAMLWTCLYDPAPWGNSYVGRFFSYRCLHPVSGVSPLVPLLLLLFAWYLWAMFQTARLRFSSMNRPRLPGPVASTSPYPLYVTDQRLDGCEPPLSCCLFENINCLLITRELTRRFTAWTSRTLNWSLMSFYLVVFIVCALFLHIQSLERFLHAGRSLTAYEWLIAIFFYPLVMIALAGWLRVLFIWSALKDGLLEQLERTPFRLAFSRLSEVDWVTMLGQSGLNIRWRDMARSTESLRQLINNKEIRRAAGSGWQSLNDACDDLNAQIKNLLLCISGKTPRSVPKECIGDMYDLPNYASRRELCFIHAVELRYAVFCERLLEHVLIPYWNDKRIGFVNELDAEHGPGTSLTPLRSLCISGSLRSFWQSAT